MKKEYTLCISREKNNKIHSAKPITLPATTKNLEKMLYMIEKMKWAKSKMIGYIFKKTDEGYTDIVYIVNRSYFKY